MMKLSAGLATLLAIIPIVAAQGAAYAQCGGIGWTGATTCVSGYACVKSNDYYSQCVPSANAPAPTAAPAPAPTGQPAPAPAPGTPSAPAAGNPYTGYEVYLSPYYAAEVEAAVKNIADPTLAARAAKVAQVPTFIWFDVVAKVPTLGTYLAEASALQKETGKKYIVQIVVYDLPDRDCAAKASNGEFAIANNGAANYRGYIDGLVAQIKKFPDVRVVAVIEPDSLANMVTNMNVPKCAGAAETYKASTVYALRQLQTVGVYMYLDAGHAGWLGWPANLGPAAQMFADLYKQAGSPSFVRGLATNVANYNALTAASPDPVTSPNPNYDEAHYINQLGPELASRGFPAQFIVDQGRSGRQNIRAAWGNWCNVNNAGFGTRPTTNTGNSRVDSIVWIKPGGESDGTSNSAAVRYDSMCGQSDAAKPAPEAGQWFQTYFENLVKNSNPAL